MSAYASRRRHSYITNIFKCGKREDHLVKDIRPPHAYNANSINKYKLAIMILIPNQLIDKVNEQGWRLISK